ncbi:MAG: DUF5680 domain-containing protein [Clostridium sp.]|nr:DUF5680 domain-containing protein [Clostridium sp.]
MELWDRLQQLRKQNGLSQEELADKIGIARQTISKWENGQAVPELNGLIALSRLYGITIDSMVKGDDGCTLSLTHKAECGDERIIDFLILAKRNTYAAKKNQVESCRTASCDFYYKDDNGYEYYDTYLGGERFVGEEAVWFQRAPVWGMNYAGRVIGQHFDGDFLKDALLSMPYHYPFRGAEIYRRGSYCYHCKVDGTFGWFQGYEDIFYQDDKIYECHFHGGEVCL